MNKNDLYSIRNIQKNMFNNNFLDQCIDDDNVSHNTFQQIDEETILLRRIERNKLYTDIKSAQIQITRAENAIHKIRNSENASAFFITKQKEEKQRNIEKEKKLQERLKLLQSGQLDKELKETIQKIQKIHKQKVQEAKRRKREINEEKRIDKLKSQEYYQKTRNSRRKERQNKYGMMKEFDRFLKISNSLPEYMQRSLKSMPNNKGYIYRGIIFFGKGKEEYNKPIVLYENSKKIKKVHEWTDTECKVYEKIGKKQKLISSRKKRDV